jgi:hypothetical protein
LGQIFSSFNFSALLYFHGCSFGKTTLSVT